MASSCSLLIDISSILGLVVYCLRIDTTDFPPYSGPRVHFQVLGEMYNLMLMLKELVIAYSMKQACILVTQQSIKVQSKLLPSFLVLRKGERS